MFWIEKNKQRTFFGSSELYTLARGLAVPPLHKNITAKASARDLAVDPNAAAAAAVVMPKIYGSNLTPDNTSSYVS